MKKKKKISVKKIIISIIILVCAYFYAYIDKMHPLYDVDVETSAYMSTGVLSDGAVEQTFCVTEDKIDGMYVKCQITGEADEVEIFYQLIDVQSDEIVAEGSIIGSDLKNNQFSKLRFENTLEKCNGKTYKFIMKEKGASEMDGVGFFYETEQEKGTELSLCGEKMNGTMIAKTISHRFDVETFIVLIGFILFIGIFFRILYNLFK